MKVRRIVTGHAAGKAVVWKDAEQEASAARVDKVISRLIWSTDRSPAHYLGDEDMGERQLGIQPPAGGTRFSVLEIAPGNKPYMHRTDTIDYVICLAGEVDMELDDGKTVKMKTGDVMVQRGTVHNWVNRGTEPCTMAVILIHAKPVEAGGKTLNAFG